MGGVCAAFGGNKYLGRHNKYHGGEEGKEGLGGTRGGEEVAGRFARSSCLLMFIFPKRHAGGTGGGESGGRTSLARSSPCCGQSQALH